MVIPTVITTSDASGAWQAARLGYIVMIVDVIDMSTTSEALLDAGVQVIYGASPESASPPVYTDPKGIGRKAGNTALELDNGVILITEPRAGEEEERKKNALSVIKGVESTGAEISAVVPNLGIETTKICKAGDMVAVMATGTGGVAFDAAYNAGATSVITGTVARTMHKKGRQPARDSKNRALELAKEHNAGIAIVAASHNSLEDILAAQYISSLILDEWK